LEEQVVRTFYMSNTVQPQDLTEIVTGLRQLLDLKRIQQLNAQNAIIIRATPDQLALAEKLINDIDKAKPEVVIQVEVLETTTERTRDLGILTGVSPGSSPTIGSVTFAPGGLPTSSSSSSSSSTTATSQTAVALNQLRHLSTADWSISLPSSVANALITDSATKIIQNPEIRTVDGQPAKLRIGNRIPVATGSIQTAGVAGVGAGVISPLLNTQFQYIDVGVNVDITPRIHPNHEVSMKVMVEVSTVAGQSNIGGINQPIIGQRKIEHDIRLKEGEANILGGLIQTSDTKTMKGLPALAKLPLFRYLFSDNTTDKTENEILIVLTPHIVRMPEWTQANLRPLSSGTETNIQVRRESDIQAPAVPSQPAIPPTAVPGGGPVAGISAAPTPETTPPAPGVEAAAAPARIRFEPQNVNLKPGQTTTVSLVLDNVKDLFSIPLMLQYNPAVISLDDVTHGGFLSGGTQEIAIVQRVDKEHGQAIISATRQPNTAGVSGSGTLLGLVIRAIAPGTSSLSVVQVNAHDSQQKAVPLVSGEATIRVEP
jgi:general secretion pathway protein D